MSGRLTRFLLERPLACAAPDEEFLSAGPSATSTQVDTRRHAALVADLRRQAAAVRRRSSTLVA